MPFGRGFFLALSKSDFLAHRVTKWGFVRRATKTFMPGEAPEDAFAACLELAKDGRRTIFTKLGEAITNKAEPEMAAPWATIQRAKNCTG